METPELDGLHCSGGIAFIRLVSDVQGGSGYYQVVDGNGKIYDSGSGYYEDGPNLFILAVTSTEEQSIDLYVQDMMNLDCVSNPLNVILPDCDECFLGTPELISGIECNATGGVTFSLSVEKIAVNFYQVVDLEGNNYESGTGLSNIQIDIENIEAQELILFIRNLQDANCISEPISITIPDC